MSEIKLNDGFAAELEEFKAAAEELSDEETTKIHAVDDLSLTAIDEYRYRFSRLWEMVYRLKLLVKKDTADIEALAERLRNADKV